MEAEEIRRDGNVFDASLMGFNATELRLELGSCVAASSATRQRSSGTAFVGRSGRSDSSSSRGFARPGRQDPDKTLLISALKKTVKCIAC